jgi:hypothetical protein
MINCPKCGSDNMIGAIFCRSCGEKLNLNEISPEVFDAPKVPASVKLAKMLQRVITLVVIVAILALLAGLFLPVTISVTGSLEQSAADVSQRKYAALQAPTARTPNKIPFSSDEATAVVNSALGLPGSGTGNKKPQLLSVEFLGSGNCKLILKTLVFGQVPMCTTLLVKPNVSAPGEVRLDVLKASIGKLPLPGPLKKQGAAQFKALNVGSVFANAEGHVAGVTVTAGTCEITVKH